jgi:hypothetical protein
LIVLAVTFVPGWGSRQFAALKKGEWRKKSVGVLLVPPEKRTRTKDDDYKDEKDWDRTLNRYSRYRPKGV